MEIDFGGIGKEYAVDRVADWATGESRDPVVCELTGDGDALVVRLHADRTVPMPADAVESLRAVGVRWMESANELSIVFPRA